MSRTFEGQDAFRRRVIGVMATGGGVILCVPCEGDDEDSNVTMSLDPKSAQALAEWIVSEVKETGLKA